MKRILLTIALCFLATAAAAQTNFKNSAYSYTSTGTTFASLTDVTKTPQTNGTVIYVRDAKQTTVCQSGGSGAVAARINGVWNCAAGNPGNTGTTVVAGNGLNLSGGTMSLLAPANTIEQTGTAETVDLSTTNSISESLTAAGPQTTTYTLTNGYDGERFTTILCNNGTGTNNRAFSYGGRFNYLYDGGVLPPLPQQGGACEVVEWLLQLTQPANTLFELRRAPVQPSFTLTNDGAGTSANLLVKETSSNTVATIATSDTDNIIGVCESNCGTSGLGLIQSLGVARLSMDGSVIAGDWVIASTSSAGKGHDAGTTRSSNSQAIGIVVSPTTGGAGVYNVLMMLGQPSKGYIERSAMASTLGTGTTTTYLALPGNQTSATEAAVGMPWPVATKLSTMQCHVAVAPGASNTYVFTMRDNLSGGGVASVGTPGNVTCTISGSGKDCQDTTNSYTTTGANGAGVGSLTDIQAVATQGGGAIPTSTGMCTWRGIIQ